MPKVRDHLKFYSVVTHKPVNAPVDKVVEKNGRRWAFGKDSEGRPLRQIAGRDVVAYKPPKK